MHCLGLNTCPHQPLIGGRNLYQATINVVACIKFRDLFINAHTFKFSRIFSRQNTYCNRRFRGVFEGVQTPKLPFAQNLGLMVAPVYNSTNVRLILIDCDVIFCMQKKHYNQLILGVFRGGLDLFDPKIALRCAQDNLGVKKVLAHSKSPIMCFARIKK